VAGVIMNAAVARIILRYLVGGAVAGSVEIGHRLATDPDIVMLVAFAIGAAVEGFYALAKRRGWTT